MARFVSTCCCRYELRSTGNQRACAKRMQLRDSISQPNQHLLASVAFPNRPTQSPFHDTCQAQSQGHTVPIVQNGAVRTRRRRERARNLQKELRRTHALRTHKSRTQKCYCV
jgi:hypothetical protein